MAIVDKNIITKGLRGQLGKTVVFRKVGDRTIVATVPSTTDNPTAAQQSHRERFRKAVVTARRLMGIPEVKAIYEQEAKRKGQPNAYNVAIADFFQAPEVSSVDVSSYLGKTGNTLYIIATDDVEVTDVTVEIRKADGSVVESGQAVRIENGSQWNYKATASNSSFAGGKIIVKAFDRPGNVTTKEIQL